MPSATDRLEFAPPEPPGLLRAWGLALLAHVLLLVALTWGIGWKRDADDRAVEAELWASVPQQAAPKPVEAPPPKVVEPPRPAPPPPPKAADINTEREKKKPEPAKKEPPKAEPKREPEKKPAEDRKKQEQEARRKAEDEAKKLEALRQENLKRIAGLAGASGAPSASGNALQSAGPSAGYAGRVRARVKPNIVFTDDVSGNPAAEVEVRSAPDGTIVGRRLLKPSGVKAWDEAVLRALDKTEVLPRDVDGRVPTPMIFTFRPKD